MRAGRPAPAITRVVLEQNQHAAEVTVYLDNGQVTKLRGPPRRGRPEALKDCLELRKVAVKCTDDPSLRQVRLCKKELEGTTWTVKDLGGRQLDGAEGAPPGYVVPQLESESLGRGEGGTAARPAGLGGANRTFRGIVKGGAASPESLVEVADVRDAVLGTSGAGGDSWSSRAKVLLQQAFKRFGPVLTVTLEPGSDGTEACVRFASAKAAEVAMTKAPQGYLPLGAGGGEVRVRQPASAEPIWRKYPPPRRRPAPQSAASEPSRKKLRPNERFATRLPGKAADAEPDESERFWEAQRQQRGAPAAPPPAPEPAPPPEPPPPVEPERPQPLQAAPGASEEDLEVAKGEMEVAAEMSTLRDKPFKQQRKALKAVRLRWHPDKNPETQAVATRVFQFIQAHDHWLAYHDLG